MLMNAFQVEIFKKLTDLLKPSKHFSNCMVWKSPCETLHLMVYVDNTSAKKSFAEITETEGEKDTYHDLSLSEHPWKALAEMVSYAPQRILRKVYSG